MQHQRPPSKILSYIEKIGRHPARFVSQFFSRKSLNHRPAEARNVRLLAKRVASIRTIDHWSTRQQSPLEEPASSLTLRPFVRQEAGDKSPEPGLPIT